MTPDEITRRLAEGPLKCDCPDHDTDGHMVGTDCPYELVPRVAALVTIMIEEAVTPLRAQLAERDREVELLKSQLAGPK